jgi:UDP-N-acetylmuramate dehydrogenase
MIRFKKDACKFGYRDSIFKKEAKEKYVITSVSLRLNREHKINTSYGAIHDTLIKNRITNPTIRDVSNTVISIRQSKLPDPAVVGNAGSFFKNAIIPLSQYEDLKLNYPDIPGYPFEDHSIKVPAGWLIEKAGWKGQHRGNAGCYEKQALVIVNLGGATGEDIWSLAGEVMESVQKQFGVALSPEVNVWR